jgi:hypothetical protein
MCGGALARAQVWSLVDVDGDGRADHASALLSGLDSPVGIAWHGGALYVAHWVDGTPGKDGEMQGGSPQIMRLPGVDAYAVAEQVGGRPATHMRSARPPGLPRMQHTAQRRQGW